MGFCGIGGVVGSRGCAALGEKAGGGFVGFLLLWFWVFFLSDYFKETLIYSSWSRSRLGFVGKLQNRIHIHRMHELCFSSPLSWNTKVFLSYPSCSM